MLDWAWEAGITAFDTAPGYGEAEALLGRWVNRRGKVADVAIKLLS
jgi:aryl-alcohol dehydrogenase-like predicted oxidoreductase